MKLDELLEKRKELQASLESTKGFRKPLDGAVDSAEAAQCDQHGGYTNYKRVIDFLGKEKVFNTPCPECVKLQLAELEQQISAIELGKKTEKINRLRANSGIPARFAEASFSNFEQTTYNNLALRTCQRYADKWLDRAKSGGGLVLCGRPGTGKNHLACAIAHQIIEQHQAEVFLTTAMRILRKVKSTWSKASEQSEDEVIRFYSKQDLLIIDEIGVQFGSESEQMILFEIINNRYEEMRPTILISNLPESELSAFIGERVLDRMREGQGAVVNFTWESYRK